MLHGLPSKPYSQRYLCAKFLYIAKYTTTHHSNSQNNLKSSISQSSAFFCTQTTLLVKLSEVIGSILLYTMSHLDVQFQPKYRPFWASPCNYFLVKLNEAIFSIILHTITHQVLDSELQPKLSFHAWPSNRNKYNSSNLTLSFSSNFPSMPGQVTKTTIIFPMHPKPFRHGMIINRL